jgi:hypothetical protein
MNSICDFSANHFLLRCAKGLLSRDGSRLLVGMVALGCGGMAEAGQTTCGGAVHCGGGGGGGGGSASSGETEFGGSVSSGGVPNVTRPTCGGAGPCGGVLDGQWQFDSVCIEGDLADTFNAEALRYGKPEPCGTMYQSVAVTTYGTTTFANGIETDNMSDRIDASLIITAGCEGAIVGSTVTLDPATCVRMEQDLTSVSGGFDTASCSFSNGDCACQVTAYKDESAAPVSYIVSGSTVTYPGSNRSWQFCVVGTTLAMWQQMGSAKPIMAVGTLHRI